MQDQDQADMCRLSSYPSQPKSGCSSERTHLPKRPGLGCISLKQRPAGWNGIPLLVARAEVDGLLLYHLNEPRPPSTARLGYSELSYRLVNLFEECRLPALLEEEEQICGETSY